MFNLSFRRMPGIRKGWGPTLDMGSMTSGTKLRAKSQCGVERGTR